MKLFNQMIRSSVVYTSLFVVFAMGFLGEAQAKTNAKTNKYETLPLYDTEMLVTKPRVALVFGAAAFRGLGYIAVLEEFEKIGLPIDLMVGTSAGAVVSVLYSDSQDVAFIKSRCLDFKIKVFIEFEGRWSYAMNPWVWNWGSMGWSSGHNFRKTLDDILVKKKFEDLPIPVIVVAADINTGKEVCINRGPIIPATYASAAFPIYYDPLSYGGHLLLDGALLNPIPVSVAKKFDPDVVIAVDFSLPVLDRTPTTMKDLEDRLQEMVFGFLSDHSAEGADYHLKLLLPENIQRQINIMNPFDTRFIEEYYMAGRLAVQKALPDILNLLSEKGIPLNPKKVIEYFD